MGMTITPQEVTTASLGLDQVDNTSDLNKPVSTATATALGGKLDTADADAVTATNLASGTLTAPALDAQTATNLANLTSATRAAGDAVWAGNAAFMSPIGQTWDGTIRAAAIAAERMRLEGLFDAANTGTGVAVGRSGLHYDLYQQLDGDTWWRIRLAWDAAAGEEHHSLWQSEIGIPVVSVKQTDGSFALVLAGRWTTSANAYAYGGSYSRNSTVGDTCTWTTPTCVEVGIRAFKTTNGGYALCTIDGDATAATFLPTAQEEVDAGRLAATALVGGGGTLNPTDRVFDSYWPDASTGVNLYSRLAEGLASAAHTIVLTVTGYKQGASSGTRLYLAGGFYAATTTTPATAGMSLCPLIELLTSSSVFEYAISYTPAGGTLYPFIGNRHGGDIEDIFTIELDGSPVTLADGEVQVGALVEVTRESHLLHPDTGATHVGSVSTTYTMRPGWGLDVAATITWEYAGVALVAYLGMLPTQANIFTKGRAAGGPVVTLTDDDGSVKGSTRSDTLCLWEDAGHGAVMAVLRNLPDAVGRWVGVTTDFAWIEDRSGGDFNKAYFQRVQTPGTETILAGDVWSMVMTLRAAWMTSTADLAL